MRESENRQRLGRWLKEVGWSEKPTGSTTIEHPIERPAPAVSGAVAYLCIHQERRFVILNEAFAGVLQRLKVPAKTGEVVQMFKDLGEERPADLIDDLKVAGLVRVDGDYIVLPGWEGGLHA